MCVYPTSGVHGARACAPSVCERKEPNKLYYCHQPNFATATCGRMRHVRMRSCACVCARAYVRACMPCACVCVWHMAWYVKLDVLMCVCVCVCLVCVCVCVWHYGVVGETRNQAAGRALPNVE